MTKTHRKLVTAIASASLLLNAVLPVLGATITVTGNGADSKNTVDVETENVVGVTQTNFASIHNQVETKANTGDNEVKKSTGGEVEVSTGDATADTTVVNAVNSNSADVECCDAGDYDLKISDNGADTKNKINLVSDDDDKDGGNGIFVTQDNFADVQNQVQSKAKTGDNEVKKSTGGDVTVETGDATAGVVVSTSANSNTARIAGDGDGGSLSAWIVGNGADSKNKIDVELERSLIATQTNFASVHNAVEAKANSGDNEVKKSTGGEVVIDTGNATALAGIVNDVNFNWADLDCDCLLGDYLLKIGENGADTKNKINLDLDGVLWAVQDNVAGSGIGNRLSAKAKTGDNEVKKSTDDSDGDPTIETGDALVETYVENSGNSNVVGGMPSFDWPDMPDMGDYDFHFGFNWGFLFAWMNG